MTQKQCIAMAMVLTLAGGVIPTVSDAKAIQFKNTSSTKKMAKGSTFTIKTNEKASTLKYTSSKKSVATVSSTGVVTAKKKGTTTITLKKGSQTKKLKVVVSKPVGYTISKTSGTSTSKVSVKVKAKKGYVVYYTTDSTFTKSKKIKAKKSKTFTFKAGTSDTTKNLSVYAVKTKTTMTTKKWKKACKNNCDTYRYKILAATLNDASTTTQPGGTSGSTGSSTGWTNPTPTPPSAYTRDDSLAGYVPPTSTSYDDVDKNTSSEGATAIMIPATAPSAKIEEASYTISKKNKLTITAPGTYTLSGEGSSQIDGLVEVDLASQGDVHLILNGINLTSTNNTAPTSDTGLITFKSSNLNRAVITLADGTTNTLTDTGATGIDKDDNTSTTYTAGIVCKKTDLTINGTGTLQIASTNGNGIKSTKGLKILNATVNVGSSSAPVGHNGVTAKTDLATSNASLNVYSTGDTLKTTLDETDIASDSTLAELGNMDLTGGSFTLESKSGDCICAYRTLNLNPATMTATASYSSSSSSDDTSSKAVKAGTTILIPSTA